MCLFGLRKIRSGKIAAVRSYLTCPFLCGLAAGAVLSGPRALASGRLSTGAEASHLQRGMEHGYLWERFASADVLNSFQSKC